MKRVLRIKIYQPDAHYRIPFSFKRRLTFPIPPYSTIKGFMCNLMGIKKEEDKKFMKLKDGLSLAVYGKYESIIKEYVWFRNLKKDFHISRFNSPSNRIIDRIPQHPGAQMPIIIDVLNNVNLVIYIYHSDENFLDEIKTAFNGKKERNSVIHLGRSEDWLVFEEIKMIQLKKNSATRIPFFTYLPSFKFVSRDFLFDNYENFYEKINANIFRFPTFYKINEKNQRLFTEFITVKLYEGGNFRKQEFYCDSELEDLPVIFANIKGNKNVSDTSKK